MTDVVLVDADAHVTEPVVERYENAGVSRLVVTLWTSSRAAREGIETFAVAAGLS